MTPNLLSSFTAALHTLFLDQMTASPSCLWLSEHLFGLLMNICMCLPGSGVCVCTEGWQALCMGRLYWLWQELPTGASGPWQCAGGPVLAPELKATASKTNQTLPLPHLCQLENDRPGHSAQRPFTINSN